MMYTRAVAGPLEVDQVGSIVLRLQIVREGLTSAGSDVFTFAFD